AREKHQVADSTCFAMSRHPRRHPSLATHAQLLDAARREDQAAVDELIRRYEPLVRRVVRTLRIPTWCDRADLAQEARIGLLFAIALRTLPTLTAAELAGLAASLNGDSYEQLAARNGSTVKAACKATYRARVKLNRALAQAA